MTFFKGPLILSHQICYRPEEPGERSENGRGNRDNDPNQFPVFIHYRLASNTFLRTSSRYVERIYKPIEIYIVKKEKQSCVLYYYIVQVRVYEDWLNPLAHTEVFITWCGGCVFSMCVSAQV